MAPVIPSPGCPPCSPAADAASVPAGAGAGGPPHLPAVRVPGALPVRRGASPSPAAAEPFSARAAPTAWNVSVSVRGLQLHLHLTSSVPAAFSAALCQRRGRQCEPEAPFYTVTRGSAPGELALLLPVHVLGSCVLVWRSDVHFARKQLLCPDGEWGVLGGVVGVGRHPPLTAPLPVSRRHFGLLALALALGLVVTVLLFNCRGAWRPADGEGHPGGLRSGGCGGHGGHGAGVPGGAGSLGCRGS
uniref:Uncharacterized protein n=1 Tax=Accipiter nisus TaxID=211598 RepID=A0A8B9MBP0_9AVES